MTQFVYFMSINMNHLVLFTYLENDHCDLCYKYGIVLYYDYILNTLLNKQLEVAYFKIQCPGSIKLIAIEFFS